MRLLRFCFLTLTAMVMTAGYVYAQIPTKMYWTAGAANKIQRANLNGSGIEDIITGLSNPNGIGLDVAGGRIYWTEIDTDKIRRADLDGTDMEDLVTVSGEPGGIALDIAGGKMYWTDSGADKIQRANLDGSNIEDLLTSANGIVQPTGIALDRAGGKMYWTDLGTNKIQRAGLDGSDVEDQVISGLVDPEGITLDVADDKMYWADFGTGGLRRANLDGTSNESLIGALSHPNFIILDIPDNGGIGNGGSPDLRIAGRVVFYTTVDSIDIYSIDPDGTDVTRLTNHPKSDIHPKWSPDGKKIVFESERDDATQSGVKEIYVMNADGSGQTRLTNNANGETTAAWSPDGSKIVFSSNRDGPLNIYVMNPDGSDSTRLVERNGSALWPSWSPDGTRIAFEEDQEIYVMNADGSNPINLTENGAFDQAPSWSPDGTRIAFMSNRDGNDEIYVMNADGSNPVRLTNHSAGDELGRWSPDGTKIVFVSDRGGQNNLYIMEADGSNPDSLTTGDNPHWQPFRHIGTTVPGVPVSRTMTIENTGSSLLTVSNITSSDARFTASPANFTVVPGDSQNVEVTFTPQSDGTHYATLTITSDDPDDPSISLIINGSSVASDTVTLVLPTAFGAPGDTLRVPLAMTNTTASPVGGLQLAVIPGDTSAAHFVGLEDAASHPGFTISANTTGDSTTLLIFSSSGAVIQPGTDISLATLVYVLDPSASLGSVIPLTLANVEIGDSSGVAIPDSSVNGALQVGIRGDVNLDGRVSILDVIRTVRIIIGREAAPDTGSIAFFIADKNQDGMIDIADVVSQVNTILGLGTKVIAAGPTSPVLVSLDAVYPLADGRLAIPVMVEANGLIAGLQATFTFNPSLLQVGAPQLAADAPGLTLDSHTTGGTLRVVVYATQPGQGIPAGHDAVMLIPVAALEGAGSPSLTLSHILLADPQAQRIPVSPGNSTAVVGKEAALPTAFSLGNARPNPFNPSTTIRFDLPKPVKVTLIVYNLLGQEVIRLLDNAPFEAGFHQVVWNGHNTAGRTTASGVYMYRIVADDFVEARKMLLLK